ncbi:Predicted PurR-regulated permease PerM [Micromonospora sediminicola]|uniref:Predicted PurR-regulated permease PerM n=1 Tax=Micromonospora sediminicola TaxID=946078 RepID=A0A1A9B9Q1_9ACTN|nr:AI-2E family transporter [Micromonospora sediminicola]SBT65801.1 Predicted PurR-regulated permease PerM [Micromonospora sediminicola]
MRWTSQVRDQARARLEAARQAEPPPFDESGLGTRIGQVLVVDSGEPDGAHALGVPRGIRVAAAWAWRLILLVAGAYVLIKTVSVLRVVVIPVIVALLLAALLQPAAALLRRRGIGAAPAAALVLVAGLVAVFGTLAMIVRTFIDQYDELADQVRGGLDEVQAWLARGPLHLDDQQLSSLVDRAQVQVTQNQGALTSGALSTATTLGELLTGFFLVLFTLFFFLRDGDRIWRFLCRLLPHGARVSIARAGHYSWHTLISYVRATVLVAFVDALGIGIGLLVLDVPLALPLAALVFLGAFIPVVGATVSGAVAVLVALVAQGPVSALIILGVVIAVQQLEGHVLQPLIMGRAVALHPLAVILAIAAGIVVAGIVGGLVAVPLLAVVNTATRYLAAHPDGQPTVDRTPPGTRPTDNDQADAEETADDRRARTEEPVPAVDSSVDERATGPSSA